MERSGQENVQQHNILEAVIGKLAQTENIKVESLANETKKQIQNVITHLINKENILMITQDAKNKDERYLSLNINVDLENLPIFDGSKDAKY